MDFFFFVGAVWDYVFADDEREANPTSFKFLQMAHAWKAKKEGGAGASVDAFVSSASVDRESGAGEMSAASASASAITAGSRTEGRGEMDVDGEDGSGSDVASSDEEDS